MIPKFRAWEIAGKRMVLVESIDFRNKFIEYTYSPYNDSNRVVSEYLNFCDVVLMQSTGLLDFNGKEIFENDIVEWEHKDTGQLVRGIVKYDTEIDEPQKVVVPKHVVDWVDNSKKYRFDFEKCFDAENQPVRVQLWLNSLNKRQAELNALALVTLIVNGADAVEIEQEKLYTVDIGGVRSSKLFKNIKTNLGFCGMTDVRFNDLTAIGYLANQRVTVLGNIYQNKELVEE